jgi:hypothetical protein
LACPDSSTNSPPGANQSCSPVAIVAAEGNRWAPHYDPC